MRPTRNKGLKMKKIVLFCISLCLSASVYAQVASDYRKAAEQGNIIAQYDLADCYFYGKGIAIDYVQAVYWYRKVAEKNDTYLCAIAQNCLGNCYYNGKGVSTDYFQAIYWYRKAAKQGLDRARYNLALMYLEGEGVDKDGNTALYWFEKTLERLVTLDEDHKRYTKSFIRELKAEGYSSSRAKIN